MDHSKIYKKEPLGYHKDIPVFSEENDYIRNYEKIAADHMLHKSRTGENPWINEELWCELEKATANLIRKYSQPGERILDVGVGLGRVLSEFSNLERYGIDISCEYLQHAKKEGIHVCFSMVEDMPYVEKSFDIVVCTDVLEHVLDLNLACAKILSVLKDDGILIIRVPYRESLRPYIEDTIPYQYIHLRNFDEYSLRLLFEKIFRCKVIEFSCAGYETSDPKLRLDLPLSDGFLSKFMLKTVKRTIRAVHKVLRVINGKLYRRALQILYYPVDINMVIRKGPDR